MTEPPATLILANARLVLETEVLHGCLWLRNGVIAAVDSGSRIPAGAVDCDGDLVLPGLVELHTDNLEWHIQPRPGVGWPHVAAILAHDAELAGAGITTVFDAIRVGSVLTGSARYDRYARPLATEVLALRAAGALKISHRLHLRAEICSDTLPDEMAEFSRADDVGIVSLMDHTPGQRQFRDIAKLAGYVMARHQMTKGQFADHVAGLQALSARVTVGHRAQALAEAARIGAVLASHDDSDLAQVAASARAGVRLAEFPTTLEAARACRDHGIAVMAGAPNLIRGGSHAGNLSAGDLADAGLIDIISSDYVPAALLNAALLLGERWGDLARAVATVTAAPAAASGMADRGRIWPGLRGDVIRVARVHGAAAVRGVWVAGNRVA